MNLVVITGRLTRDPELKYGASGSAYCRFSVAVNRAFQKDQTDFINCVAFGKTAELIGEYLRKGRMCGVQGRLQVDTYENNGEKKYTTSVVVERIEFLESRSSGENNFDNDFKEKNSYKDNSKANEKSYAPEPDFEDDDEFPF
jgi:single-strand DNA-binding protein